MQADEPAGGLLSRLADVPGLGALSIGVAANGPWAGVETRVDAKAGDLRLAASGRVDLPGQSSDFQVTASAPAMTPRPDVSWQAVTLQAHVTGEWLRPHATGTLDVDELAAAGASVRRLQAALTGDLGHVGVRATLENLLLPGPQGKIFAAEPVTLDANADLTATGRPVQVELSHKLLNASGTIRTEADLGADLTVHAPDLAGLDPEVRGEVSADLHLTGPLADPSLQAEVTGQVAAGGMPAANVTASLRGHGLPPAASGEVQATIIADRGRVTLSAAVDEHAKATLHLEGRGLGPAETVRLDAEGTQAALALRAAATGAGVQATAAATLDAVAQRLNVIDLQATWQNERITLQAPAQVSFADGVTVNRALFGLRQATLEVAGRASPALDLRATLRGLPLALADDLVPGLGADGTVNGEARLTGTPARPAGTLRLTATGLRLRTGPAAAFPAATASATATLAGANVRIDANASLASARVAVTGTAPLATNGPLALHATGTLDLALFDRVLAAGGQRVRGKATLDAAITGTPMAPRIGGTIVLAGGEVQDVVHGIRIHAIDARLRATGDSLRIEHLSGAAGAGTISGSGSIGLAAPLPINIDIVASNASPIASDAFTATLDGNIAVRGSLAERISASGTITVRQAEIRVPSSSPPPSPCSISAGRPRRRRRRRGRISASTSPCGRPAGCSCADTGWMPNSRA